RSFVQPRYGGTRALDYLSSGIAPYVKANPNIKYMSGPVSISGAFPAIAKGMLVFHYNYNYSREINLVVAGTPFSYSS
ncbi:GNAT family N-acetyltransferase, partial [Aliarcobacter butzleri]